MKIVNLTEHEIVVDNGFFHITFPPSGTVARIEQIQKRELIDFEVNESIKIKLPVFSSPTIKVLNLPEQQPDTYYIVSRYFGQFVRREDLLVPLSDNSAERDEFGNILSVKGFLKFLPNQELVEFQLN